MDLSVVIATHADSLGLYLTTFAVIEQLSKTTLDWEIVIAADGGSEYKWEKQPNVRCLRIRTGSPQGTRDAGIGAAQSQHVLCIESHVIVSDMESFLRVHKELGGVMTFPNRIAEGPEMYNAYGTDTDFEGTLWFKRTLYNPPVNGPRRVPQFGHSCFMIDRHAYEAIGGYGNALTGWGGEEPLLCFKFWMLGYVCWQVPMIWHAHFLDNRGAGAAMASENFTRNFKIVKYIITGQNTGVVLTPEIQQERARICLGPFGGDIKKLQEYFKQEGIIS